MIFLTISPREDSLNFECNEIRICRGCFAYEVELHNIHEKRVAAIFSEFSRATVSKYDGMSQLICNHCLYLVRKFHKCQSRWSQANSIMQQMMTDNKLITKEWLDSEELVKLKPNLKYTKTCLVPCAPVHQQHESTDSTDEEIMNSDDDEESVKIDLDDAKNDASDDIFDEESVKIDLYDVQIDDSDNIFDEETVPSELHNYDETVYLEQSDKDSSMQDETDDENEITAKRSKRTDVDTETKKSYKDIGIKDKVNLDPQKKTTLPCNQDKQFRTICNTMEDSKQQMEDFEKECNVVVHILTEEEQKKEMEEMRILRYKDAPYKCSFCHRGYTSLWAHEVHMKVHDPAFGAFICNICGIRYKSERRRSKHIDLRHRKRFICKECGVVNKSVYHARLHFMRHNPTTINSRCEHCQEEFAVPLKYLHHLYTHVFNEVQCELCTKTQPGEAGLEVHMKIKHKTAVKCGSCKKHFQNMTCLKTHLKGRNDGVCDPRLKPCSLCGTNFETPELLKTHFEEHIVKKYNCYKCRSTFVSRSDYVRHMQTHEPAQPSKKEVRADSLICEICGKEFKTNYLLRCHHRVHTGERPLKCPMCPKSFRVITNLKYHINMHTGARPYKCELCSQAFRQPNQLKRHLLVHTRERPHECKICGKRFGLAGNMREHMRSVHAGHPSRKKQRRQDNQNDSESA